MTNIFANFLSSLSLLNLGLAFSGVLAGIIIGALPGLSATMAVAILVPFTFALEPSRLRCLGIAVSHNLRNTRAAIVALKISPQAPHKTLNTAQ